MMRTFAFVAQNSASVRHVQCTRRVGARRALAGARLGSSITNGSKCQAFFNFNKNEPAAPTLSRSDYGAEEVTEYFEYMGMLAEEGNYDRLEEMLASGVPACDLLLLMACKEGDTPRVEELLAAGADPTIKDKNGLTPIELCKKEEIIEMVQAVLAKAK